MSYPTSLGPTLTKVSWEKFDGSGERGPWCTPFRLTPETQRLRAGCQARSAPGAASAPPPISVDLDETLAWVQHKIVFEHRPLGEVAAEFNRHGKIPVEINDEELRGLPVTGMFEAGDNAGTNQRHQDKNGNLTSSARHCARE
jgi:hypothetical protein